MNGHVHVARLLIDAKAKLDAIDAYKFVPEHRDDFKRERSEAIYSSYCRFFFSVFLFRSRTAINWAAYHGSAKFVHVLAKVSDLSFHFSIDCVFIACIVLKHVST